MTERELKSGKEFSFVNETDTYEAEVSFGKVLGGGERFKIYFNGKYVHLSKGFISLQKKLNTLKESFSLTEQ